MSDLDDLQRRVGEWGERTFPNATNGTITGHLSEEVGELADSAAVMHRDHIAEEAADCLLLLLQLAHRVGFSLFDAAVLKMRVNQARTWNTVTAAGYVKHDEVPHE